MPSKRTRDNGRNPQAAEGAPPTRPPKPPRTTTGDEPGPEPGPVPGPDPQLPPNRSREPAYLRLIARGIRTGNDLAHFLSALMLDLSQGLVPLAKVQTLTNLAGKLLKVIELRLRYGQQLADMGYADIAVYVEEIERATGD